jgi:tetratricopeptide (TPR) repeat protein
MGINPKLIEALAAAPKGGREAEMRVYTELLQSNLLVPVKHTEAQPNIIEVPSIPIRGGKSGLPAFTHSQAAKNWQSQWDLFVEFSAREVCKMVLDRNLTALVIDPAGPQWLELRQAEIEALAQSNFPLSGQESTAKSIEYFKQGTEIVLPYLPNKKAKPKDTTTPAALKELQEGIEYLKLAVKFEYRHWQSNWFLGKAYQLLGKHEQACGYFMDGYATNPNEINLSRELMTEYLEVGKTAEALLIANKILNQMPQDAGLVADIGLVFLMNGQIKEAKQKIKQSLSIDGQDQITKNLLKLVEEVESGKRKPPAKLSDLRK